METIVITPEIANIRETLSIGYSNLSAIGGAIVALFAFVVAFFARS